MKVCGKPAFLEFNEEGFPEEHVHPGGAGEGLQRELGQREGGNNTRLGSNRRPPSASSQDMQITLRALDFIGSRRDVILWHQPLLGSSNPSSYGQRLNISDYSRNDFE